MSKECLIEATSHTSVPMNGEDLYIYLNLFLKILNTARHRTLVTHSSMPVRSEKDSQSAKTYPS